MVIRRVAATLSVEDTGAYVSWGVDIDILLILLLLVYLWVLVNLLAQHAISVAPEIWCGVLFSMQLFKKISITQAKATQAKFMPGANDGALH